MELRWPWLVVALAVVVLLALVVALRVRPARGRDAVLVAHAARLRSVPRYRTLVRRQRALLAARTAATLLVLAGTILLSGRLTSVQATEPEVRNRDIILCLDGSGSMDLYNAEVVRQFQEIVSGLRGERVGMTIFSGASITAFPLTDDYEFLTAELDRAETAFQENDYDYVAGTQLDDSRASQMGDGLVSCVQGFDRPDEERGRAIVLASDNDPQGPPIYTLDDASRYAVDHDVVVYGIASPETPTDGAVEEFRSAVEATGGEYSTLDDSGSGSIVSGIQRLERTRIAEPPEPLLVDEPALGGAITAAGVGLLVLTGLRRPERGRPERDGADDDPPTARPDLAGRAGRAGAARARRLARRTARRRAPLVAAARADGAAGDGDRAAPGGGRAARRGAHLRPRGAGRRRPHRSACRRWTGTASSPGWPGSAATCASSPRPCPAPGSRWSPRGAWSARSCRSPATPPRSWRPSTRYGARGCSPAPARASTGRSTR